jgi:hypothetical protein
MTAVEGTIFDFGFLKKYDLSLLLIEGWAFDRLVSVNAHLLVVVLACQRRHF